MPCRIFSLHILLADCDWRTVTGSIYSKISMQCWTTRVEWCVVTVEREGRKDVRCAREYMLRFKSATAISVPSMWQPFSSTLTINWLDRCQ